ncbi:hypothetical protein J6590_087822 [Homalodisca vitripennis]|nr:hypothetical protein J6590_087822 [Homalodisca vitripennis]
MMSLWCNGSTFTRQVRDPGSSPGEAKHGRSSPIYRNVDKLNNKWMFRSPVSCGLLTMALASSMYGSI